MLKKAAKLVVCLMACGIVVALCASYGRADGGGTIQARLTGFQEVPANLSAGEARLEARIVGQTIEFKLQYANLTGNPTMSHIHLAQRGVNGGVVAFLCGGGGQAACPEATSGTIQGTIAAANILALPTQNLAAGDFAAAVRAIRHGVTYVNIHTPNSPAGEIRGQIQPDFDLSGFDG